MKKLITYGFILGAICVIASGLLAGVYSLTRPRIIIQAQKQEEATLKEVFPAAGRFEPIKSEEGETAYYKVYAKDDSLLGLAFKAFGKGYSGQIETMVGMDTRGIIKNIKILNQTETPGLGMRIAEPSFTGQFAEKNIPDLSQVQAITGATISSKAVIDSVKKRAQEIEEIIKNENTRNGTGLSQSSHTPALSKQEEATLKEVFPAAGRFEPIKSEEGETAYYKVYAKDDSLLGLAFKAFGKGYSGQIETMVGMDTRGIIKNIKILNESVTLDLGVTINEPSFTGQFKGKNLPDLNQVQAIAGATISSKAVIDSVKKRAQEIREIIKNGK